jgi:hypothetical protein
MEGGGGGDREVNHACEKRGVKRCHVMYLDPRREMKCESCCADPNVWLLVVRSH